MPRRRRRKAAANPRRRRNRAAANPRKRRRAKAAANPRRRKHRRAKAASNPRRRHKRRAKAAANPRRRRRARASAAANPRRRRRRAKAAANPRRRRRARASAAANPRRRRRRAKASAAANPRRRRRARASAAANPRRRRRARASAAANPRRRRRRAKASAAANPRRRRRARASAAANPRRRRRHARAKAASNPRRHHRRHARSNPLNSVTEIISAVAAAGAGVLAAKLWHRFSHTYNPFGDKLPTDKFVGGDGTAANAKNIAMPSNWMSMGGQFALTVAPFLAIKYGKIHNTHVKTAMQGFAVGAGAHLLGQVVTDFLLLKILKNTAFVHRLFPQEAKAHADIAAGNTQVAGTLAGHPPLIEELHAMFPAMPKHLMHSFGVGYGPSYTAGPYSQPQAHQLGVPHGHLSAPPPPPPPPGAAVMPFSPPPPPGGHQHHGYHGGPGNIQLSPPCATPDMRRDNMQMMMSTARRELHQQDESLGLGRLPFQMNPDSDPRDRE